MPSILVEIRLASSTVVDIVPAVVENKNYFPEYVTDVVADSARSLDNDKLVAPVKCLDNNRGCWTNIRCSYSHSPEDTDSPSSSRTDVGLVEIVLDGSRVRKPHFYVLRRRNRNGSLDLESVRYGCICRRPFPCSIVVEVDFEAKFDAPAAAGKRYDWSASKNDCSC